MKPAKLSMGPWNQGLYTQSATQKEVIGVKREDMFGNIYRYSKAGAANLAAGKLTVNNNTDADWTNKACGTASVGDLVVSLTITAVDGTGIAENYFQGGVLALNDGTAEGISYPIIYSESIGASDTVIKVTLATPLVEALTNATEFTLKTSPWMGTVISDPDQADMPTGVPLIDVTANYFYWSKTRGDTATLADENVAKGLQVTIGSSVAGAVEAVDGVGEPLVGIASEALVDTEYHPVFLMID